MKDMCTALVIDSDSNFSRWVSTVLESHQVSIQETYIMPGKPYDLVYLSLSDEDQGLALLRNIKKSKLAGAIIVTVDLLNDEIIGTALENGADDFIRKPITPQVLKYRTEATLTRLNAVYYKNAIIEATPDEALILDKNLRVVYAYPEKAELLGKKIDECLPENVGVAYRAGATHVLGTGKNFNIPYRLGDNTYTAYMTYYANSSPKVICIIRDLSDLMHAYDSLEEKLQALESIDTIATAILSNHNRDKLIDTALENIKDILNAYKVFFWENDGSGKWDIPTLAHTHVSDAVDDVLELFPKEKDRGNRLAIPIYHEHQLYGVIIAYPETNAHFAPAKVDLAKKIGVIVALGLAFVAQVEGAKNSCALYEHIAEDLADFVCHWDHDTGRILYVNKAIKSNFGDLTNKVVFDWLVDEDKLKEFMVNAESLTSTSPPVRHVVQLSLAPGRYFEFISTPYFTDNGDISYWQSIGRDVTDLYISGKDLPERVQHSLTSITSEVADFRDTLKKLSSMLGVL